MSKENKIIKVSLRYANINSKKHKLELYSNMVNMKRAFNEYSIGSKV